MGIVGSSATGLVSGRDYIKLYSKSWAGDLGEII